MRVLCCTGIQQRASAGCDKVRGDMGELDFFFSAVSLWPVEPDSTEMTRMHPLQQRSHDLITSWHSHISMTFHGGLMFQHMAFGKHRKQIKLSTSHYKCQLFISSDSSGFAVSLSSKEVKGSTTVRDLYRLLYAMIGKRSMPGHPIVFYPTARYRKTFPFEWLGS